MPYTDWAQPIEARLRRVIPKLPIKTRNKVAAAVRSLHEARGSFGKSATMVNYELTEARERLRSASQRLRRGSDKKNAKLLEDVAMQIEDAESNFGDAYFDDLDRDL